ncbi:MAG: PepSY domain-containing protein [Pseudomonadota bacterium]|nr:PepSY domain-containing protein [Pseudomonadota bacterium]
MSGVEPPTNAIEAREPLSAKLHRWHQKVGIFVCLAVIAWGLSGLAHPIISRLNPKPAAFVPPSETVRLSDVTAPGAALSALDIKTFRSLQLLGFEHKPYYRVETDEGVLWLDAATGRVRENGEHAFAVKLARYYLGDELSSVGETRLITAFDSDYLYIDRLLPVYRVDFQRPDGMRAYVETASGRLATLTDDRKALTGRLFRLLHSWGPVAGEHWSFLLMAILLLGSAFTASAGMLVYGVLWRRNHLSDNKPVSVRWHRSLGALISVAALGFALSGLFHLTAKHLGATEVELPSPERFHVSEITADWSMLGQHLDRDTITKAQLIRMDGKAYWQVQNRPTQAAGGHGHHGAGTSPPPQADQYLDASTAALRADAAVTHALELAARYAGISANDPSQTRLVSAFGGDYGFIFKRLPVYSVSFTDLPGHDWYVETRSGALAAHVGPLARMEGWVFGYIHKWHFLDGFGKDLRDILMASAAVLLVLVATMGAWHFIRLRLP